MERIEVKTLKELKDSLDQLLSKQFIFRGINDKDQLLPQLLRENKNCPDKEFDLLKTFEKYYELYSSAHDCWEFLSIAQHYGLMTRLIDFSRNPYVALFFSLRFEKKSGCDYEIYAIDPKGKFIDKVEILKYSHDYDSLLGHIGFKAIEIEPDRSFSDTLRDIFKGPTGIKNINVIEPNLTNSRMLAQQGLFVFPDVLEKQPIMDFFASEATVIVIPDTLRKEALEYLSKMGFDEFHLMPDLASICSEANNQVLNE